jgi:hypothetical protein
MPVAKPTILMNEYPLCLSMLRAAILREFASMVQSEVAYQIEFETRQPLPKRMTK